MSDEKRHRDAVTGLYVSDEYADQHPDTTVAEEKDGLADAVRRYLDHLYAAEASGERSEWPSELEQMTGWEVPE